VQQQENSTADQLSETAIKKEKRGYFFIFSTSLHSILCHKGRIQKRNRAFIMEHNSNITTHRHIKTADKEVNTQKHFFADTVWHRTKFGAYTQIMSNKASGWT